jgi:FAD/FMN-containing dehydrogenase
MSHDERVQRIAREVKEKAERNEHFSIGKSAVSHMVPNPHDPRHKDRKIDIRDMNALLSIDVAGQRCVAEPGLTFAELVPKTLAHGLVPKLVPELQKITVGGAVSGCSVESMSYRYGGFHDSCLEYEIVTGTGEVVRCSRDRDGLLFEMVHGSYGTLGIITELTFELIPAKPFVALEYRLYRTFDEFQAQLLERCACADFDFVDAIVHGRDAFVLCLGRLVESAARVSSYRWLDIYYKSTLEKRSDTLTTFDYLFRYDTECHWLTKTLPGMETKPMRLVFGKMLLGSTNLLTWSKRLRPVLKLQKHPPVVVDVFIPSSNFRAFFEWYERAFDYYPLWVVPYRLPRPYPWIHDDHAAKMGSDLFIDCAVYGKRNDTPGVDYSQMLEEKTFELGGVKTLISQNHYTPERFWEVYNRKNYAAVKARTDPKNLFRDLYQKFHFPRTGSAPG